MRAVVVFFDIFRALQRSFCAACLLWRCSGDFALLVCVPVSGLQHPPGAAYMAVMRMILSSECKPSPVLVTFTVPLKSDYARTMLANSITLTPGTITVSVEGDTYTVHCLDESLSSGMEDSVFVKMLKKMEA